MNPSWKFHANLTGLTLLTPGYFGGSKTRAEAAAASTNKIGVSNMIQGYKLAQNIKIMFFTPNHEKYKYSLLKIAVSAVLQTFQNQRVTPCKAVIKNII